MSQLKSPPVPRLERNVNPLDELEGFDSTAWAVSYSDLLMVLMSFFVIFFSFNDSKTSQNALENVTLLLKKNKSSALETSSPSLEKPQMILKVEGRVSTTRILSEQMSKLFSSDQLHTSLENDTLTVQFSGNSFETRSYRLNEALRNQLRQTVQALLPYKDQIELVVVGHADSQPVSNVHPDFILDNYDLSAFRALHILKFLGTVGLSLSHMSAQGDADNTSKTRSFSLRIQNSKVEGFK